ncbi:alpha/beta-hydrolase [Testicularia cyperi]|uniref:Alpha/beta-hydrolase n=1 Tax=Testicularia cyperi TaxID=1882483 RepID=A0A317XEW3_9BASI|nr:alpha/beta-hydrolase [Testicularia cyperi]
MGYLPSFGSVLRVVGGVLVVSLISTAGLLYRYQTSLIYPSSFPSGSRAQVSTPDEYDLPYHEHELVTPDAEKVRVFVMLQGTKLATARPSRSSGSNQDGDQSEDRKSTSTQTGRVQLDHFDSELAKTRPTVLFLHANAGNMGHRLPIAAVFFKRFGCNVVMLSYRGYGFSSGSPSERGIKIDTQTTLDFIRAHPSLSPTVLVAYGQSIGGAIAIDLAARNPASVHALLLENTFLSIPELIPHVLPPVRPFAFLCREFWNSGIAITKISEKVPVLFLSGRQDELVPSAHMDALFGLCRSAIKAFKQFPSGTHNDTCIQPRYFEYISEFLLAHVVGLVRDRDIDEKGEDADGLQQGAAELDVGEAQKTGPTAQSERASGDEADDWVKMSHSEVIDAAKDVKSHAVEQGQAPTLSRAPEL